MKIQARAKGHLTRKYVDQYKHSGGMLRAESSKYFTKDESMETSKGLPYNPSLPLQKKPAFTFKTGAVYEGEWRGQYREGFGT